jgi:hypothetical protein
VCVSFLVLQVTDGLGRQKKKKPFGIGYFQALSRRRVNPRAASGGWRVGETRCQCSPVQRPVSALHAISKSFSSTVMDFFGGFIL